MTMSIIAFQSAWFTNDCHGWWRSSSSPQWKYKSPWFYSSNSSLYTLSLRSRTLKSKVVTMHGVVSEKRWGEQPMFLGCAARRKSTKESRRGRQAERGISYGEGHSCTSNLSKASSARIAPGTVLPTVTWIPRNGAAERLGRKLDDADDGTNAFSTSLTGPWR